MKAALFSKGRWPLAKEIRRHQSSSVERVSSLIDSHRREAKRSAERIRASGPSSLLTALVIAIALALPTSLHLLLNNVEAVLNSWDQQNNLTLFFDEGVSEQKSLSIQKKVDAWSEVESTRYISAEEALEEFRESSGLEDVLSSLDENPLPATLILRPKVQDLDSITKLEKKLSDLKHVESVVVDTAWIGKLNAILVLGERFVLALGFALYLAVLLVIFNTIRLAIANRAEEIVITQLVGATQAYVRRPFLYTGGWFGLAGGFIALILAEVLVILLEGPVMRLSNLYQSDFTLQGVGGTELLLVPMLGLSVGVAGAFIAVSDHLRTLIPE